MSIVLHRIRTALVTSLVLAAPAVAAGQELLRTHPGAAAGDASGVVRVAGDVNHDGQVDLVIGAPHHATAAGADVGSVRVISGSDGTTLLTLNGSAPGELFGWSCGAAGDIDADGRGDLVIGAPGAPGSSAPGRVFIVSGSTGAVLRTITGTQAGAAFGFAVAGGRDLDGDGIPDIVVGAPRHDAGGVDNGRACSISGATGAVLHEIQGAASGDQLGGAIDLHSVVITQMGDSEPGVIIGCTQGGNGGPGQVLTLTTGFALAKTFTGSAAGSGLGASVAFAGDVDGDGTTDLLAGSSAPGGAGSVRVWSGQTSATLFTISAPQAGTGFGSVAAAVGDVNGDGRPDIAVGEPLADAQGTDSGSVRIFSGSNGAQLHVVHGPAAGARFGSAIACAGDISGDLLADFAVGAPGDAASGPAAGSAFVLSLTRWEDVSGGLPGVNGIPRLEGQGGLVAQTMANLSLSSARPIAGVTLVLGYSLHIDAAAGALLPAADVVTPGLLTNVVGALDYSFQWPAGIPSGFTCYYQFVISDPCAAGGQARSNTVAAKVP